MTETRKRTVLLVDDDQFCVDSLSIWLEHHDYDIMKAYSAADAMLCMEQRLPDIILLDFFMPESNGLEVLKQIRMNGATKAIPVILVSGADDTQTIVDAMEAGANDYVTKPIDLRVMLARLRTHLKMGELVAKLEAQTAILTRLADHDELTHVYNRRSICDVLDAELSRCTRYGNDLSVLMLDIDLFKRVNDELGHPAGDELLKQFVERVVNSLRATDVVGRYGGDEFLAVLRETNVVRATNAAERIRRSVADDPFVLSSGEQLITVSVGVATLPPAFDGSDQNLIEMADQAMYEAKRLGRNKVCLFGARTPALATAGARRSKH